MRFFFLLRTLLEENLYQKAVQFKDIIHGKFQNVTKKINEVNSTVTKSATVKCTLIISWKQPMKTSVLSTVVLPFCQFSPNTLQYRESTVLKEINKHKNGQKILGRLIIWCPLKLIYFKNFWPWTGQANIFEGVRPN
jgi:hypothetical protein